jgi:manganese/iron transport system permease protein/iron/zinc/copper transport system permease protein
MELLLEPLQYRFFLHGLAVSVLTGSLCGLLGVYIVLRQMSYIGHGLAHAVFGGAVASFLLHLNFYIGAGIWGVTAVVLIDKLAARREINTDAAIGIITTASFAVGVALMSRMRRFTQDFEAALFGNV